MAYIGKTPTPAPLTSSDIASDIINSTHIGDTAISGFDALATAPADTDEFLISDGGVLKRLDASLVGGGGITEADQWRLSADTNDGTNGDVAANWERNDSTGFNYIGSGMTESSGIFTFPSTGYYLLILNSFFRIVGGDLCECSIHITTNNSSYTEVAATSAYNGSGTDIDGFNGTTSYIVDVTDTSNVKTKLRTGSMANNTRLMGSSVLNRTTFTFIRLGDT